MTRRAGTLDTLHGIDQQGNTLQAVEPPGVEKELAETLAPVAPEMPWRRVQCLARQAVVGPEPTGYILRDREDPAALAEASNVHGVDGVTDLSVLLGVAEGAELAAPQIVGFAMLVEEPRHLTRMPHEVARKLRRNHEIDGDPVALFDVQQAPGKGLSRDLGHRIPPEGNVDEVDAKPAPRQLVT